MQPAAQIQTTAPTANFQSTSTLTGSGSALSATPMLGEDGTATLDGASYSPAQAPSGPRRIGPVTPEGDPTPIGDAVWPLLVMAMVFAGVVGLRRKRTPAK